VVDGYWDLKSTYTPSLPLSSHAVLSHHPAKGAIAASHWTLYIAIWNSISQLMFLIEIATRGKTVRTLMEASIITKNEAIAN